MSFPDCVAAVWHYHADQDDTSRVIPDGCQDLIIKTITGGKRQWLVSPLFNQTKHVTTVAQTRLQGFRFKPGVQIDEKKLQQAMRCHTHIDLLSLVDDNFRVDPAVEEALAYLADNARSVTQVARSLGVTVRTLQRLLQQHTGKSPSYWLQLARARRAARDVVQSECLIQVAYEYGFSDQSHMTREFRRWFGVSPVKLRQSPDIISQLGDVGYGE